MRMHIETSKDEDSESCTSVSFINCGAQGQGIQFVYYLELYRLYVRIRSYSSKV